MPRINYSACPACGSSAIAKRLSAKDYTVSGEFFEIFECAKCTLRFTQDVPDQDEIGRYYKSADYISHTDTREGLVNRAYHAVRNHTLDTKKKLLEGSLRMKSGKLLDIGAGTGAFAAYMKERSWQVTGLEPDAETRQRAEAKNNLKLLPADELFNLQLGDFDAITMWHVLEHVHALHQYLEQIKKLLSQKGIAFIAVPNYTSADAKHYGEFWAAYDVPRHLYHFSPAAMRSIIEAHGLIVKDLKPMWFDSFYVSMLSEQYKTGHTKHIAAVWEGLQSNLQAAGNVERCSSLIYIIVRK